MEITFSSESTVDLVRSNASDDDVAMAAWVSFGNDREERLKDRDRVKGLINFLWREGHYSPFEHSNFTFRVNTPLFVSREIMTHKRSLHINEESQRYSAIEPKFYIPSTQRPLVQKGKAGQYNFEQGSSTQYTQVQSMLEYNSRTAWATYQGMLELGVAKEVARDALPVNIFTNLYVTVNARNLLHFIDRRAEAQALYEIQEVANKMADHIEGRMPFTYEAWQNNRG